MKRTTAWQKRKQNRGEATARAVAYLIRNPSASAREVAGFAGCTTYIARKLITQRQTPVKVLTSPSPTEGRKDDHGKLPWHLLPPDAIEEILKVLEYGAGKYAPRNWEKGMAWSRPFAALMRHMWAWWRGEDCDPETGFTHLAHAACCILFLLAYEKRNIGTDDRPHGNNQTTNP
jgi:hypothetical protein